MQITKSFDVKISVIFPYLTKNISEKDSERISRNTLFKYEPQKTISTPQFAAESSTPVQDEEDSPATKLVKRFKKIYDDFDAVKRQAEKNLEGIVYLYDVTSLNDEDISTADESVFGVASGEITFEKYKKAIELKEMIEEEMQRREIEKGVINNGSFSVA